MNIVFLTRESPPRLWLINELHQSFPVKKVFFQTKHAAPVDWPTRLGKLVKDPTKLKNLRMATRQLLASWLFRKEAAAQRAFEAQVFFGGGQPRLNPSIPFERVYTFNCPETLEKIRSENPDIILVFGTEILRGAILQVAKRAMLNIHPAILPQYRGGGMPDWCYLQNDFEHFGVTVHLCTTALDGGDIVGQKFFRFQKGEAIYMHEHKATLAALELVKEVLAQFRDGTVQYSKQQSALVWRKKDLTLFRMIRARRNLARHLAGL